MRIIKTAKNIKASQSSSRLKIAEEIGIFITHELNDPRKEMMFRHTPDQFINFVGNEVSQIVSQYTDGPYEDKKVTSAVDKILSQGNYDTKTMYDILGRFNIGEPEGEGESGIDQPAGPGPFDNINFNAPPKSTFDNMDLNAQPEGPFDDIFG